MVEGEYAYATGRNDVVVRGDYKIHYKCYVLAYALYSESREYNTTVFYTAAQASPPTRNHISLRGMHI